ncbi:MAG: type III pantothenate kinase [Saprospiraceae bacterium]|nr:MAG: type III pantothenate kinase [Saprospiraceae bacterium]
MNLTVDIGNTRTKIGVFNGSQLVEKIVWQKWEPEDLFTLATNQTAQNVILSTVAKSLSEKVAHIFQKHFYYLELTAETPLPIENKYKTPQTLGKDRLAAVVGAFALFPKTNVLVVDAGTCITYDLLTKEGVYQGGNISPGLKMRIEAMHQMTNRLPLVPMELPEEALGKTTQTALQNGALLGAILEFEGFLAMFEAEFGQVKVILTGGDADFFAKKRKRKIFVNPDLVLIGLNKILNHNVECLA